MPTDLDLIRLHAAYAQGLSPERVIDHVMARIAEVSDPGIFISRVPMADLMAASRALPPFDPARLPLWGVPFAVKDNIDVAGMPTTAGCPGFATTPGRSARVVESLTAAGALLIGKTNLDQFATGLVGVRTPYPVPRNAIDPELVPGGSSSGSAVAVAQGIVTFALGTDTAGSGRIPAGLNNIVGLKPSVGAVSCRGVLPACRTLDCVSVFAGSVDDAWAAYSVIAGVDPEDSYSRPVTLGRPGNMPPGGRIGVPRKQDLRFLGDAAAAEAWRASDALVRSLDAKIVEIDLTPFFETAALLYEGAWVAERYQAVREFIESRPADMHPVTRGIIEGARRFTAADAFAGLYRLQDMKRATEPIWQRIDALMVPTAPNAPTLADLAADPIAANSALGLYTNFVNLLDLAALAVPGPWRPDRLAAGVTFIGPRSSDAQLAGIGRAFHNASGVGMGAARTPLAPVQAKAPETPAGFCEIAVVGAHLSGLALNREITALGGCLVRATRTEPSYRLFALPGGPPHRPGLLRVADDGGTAIAVEVWALPPEGFARFVSAIPAPLGIGTLRLADGTRPKGFLCEPEGVVGATDISSFGGWRAYVSRAG